MEYKGNAVNEPECNKDRQVRRFMWWAGRLMIGGGVVGAVVESVMASGVGVLTSGVVTAAGVSLVAAEKYGDETD